MAQTVDSALLHRLHTLALARIATQIKLLGAHLGNDVQLTLDMETGVLPEEAGRKDLELCVEVESYSLDQDQDEGVAATTTDIIDGLGEDITVYVESVWNDQRDPSLEYAAMSVWIPLYVDYNQTTQSYRIIASVRVKLIINDS